MSNLSQVDPEIFAVIEAEKQRQVSKIELIASENYTSQAVLEAQGSVLTNKYAEGYPAARYYGGCENVDMVEEFARARATKLFGADHANVQPHSGAQANMAMYFTLAHPGDTVMGMNLAQGGHLTHGSPVNFSGRLYNIVPYGVNRETEQLDYDEIERLAVENKPKVIIAGATAYSRTIDFPRFREIADKVGAYLVVDMAHIAGLVAAGVHPSPVPYAQLVTSTTHKTLRGPRGGFILSIAELAQAVDKAVFPGAQGGPLMHTIAAKAVAFHEAMKPEFVTYQRAVVKNAAALADELQSLGLRIVSGGTDNHLMLVDLTPLKVTGKAAAEALDLVGITVNKNAIPFDPLPPVRTSGIRLGSPAVTTRGFGTSEMRIVAGLIVKILSNMEDEVVAAQVSGEIKEICSHFPVPGIKAPVKAG